MTRGQKKSTLIYSLLVLLMFSVLALANKGYDLSLRDAQYFNGWALAGVMAILMTLAARKRLSTLPLGRVRLWLQVHFYVGLLALGLFLLHAGIRLPDSVLEQILYGLFLLITLSGLIGSGLAKTIPQRIEARTEPVIFERIPQLRSEIAQEAEALALQSAREGQMVSLSKLYQKNLASYFSRPRHIREHLLQSNASTNTLLSELDAIERYQDADGRERLKRMRDLVLAKSHLDFQTANAGLLKVWLFVHVPAAFGLVAFIIFHVLVAYAYSTGIA